MALSTVLGVYAYRSYQTIERQAGQAAELKDLSIIKASLEAQLRLFAGRMADLDSRLSEIKSQDADVAALKDHVSRQLGLEPGTPLSELLPYLRDTLSWADPAPKEGAAAKSPSEPKKSSSLPSRFAYRTASATQNGREWSAIAAELRRDLGGAPPDLVHALYRDLGRIRMEADDTGHYLAMVKGGLSGVESVLAATPTFLPVEGRLSSLFGSRPSPFGRRSRERHQGLDIPAPVGTAVRAPADGTVLSVGRAGGYGIMVTVDHGHGLVTRYAHLSEALVKPGDEIRRGQHLARTGNTGRSTGPHLHYETLVAGVPVDPLTLLPPQIAQNALARQGQG